MKKFLSALMIAALMCSSANAGVIEAVGRGVDQQSAIRAALRQAIEQEIGAVVDSRMRIKNHQLIEQEIRLKSAGFIESYEIVSTRQINGIFEATVRADVRSKQLRAELMTLLEKQALVETAMDDPRIKIHAVDGRGRELIDVETEFSKALKNHGFNRIIIDADDADYIAEILDDGEKITARLIATASGEIICAETFEIRQRMFTDTRHWAINNAAQRLAHAALERAAQLEQHIVVMIDRSDQSTVDRSHQSTIDRSHRATTERSSVDPERLIERLKALDGVRGVFRRSLDEFDVNFDGTASELAAALERDGFVIRELRSTMIKI